MMSMVIRMTAVRLIVMTVSTTRLSMIRMTTRNKAMTSTIMMILLMMVFVMMLLTMMMMRLIMMRTSELMLMLTSDRDGNETDMFALRTRSTCSKPNGLRYALTGRMYDGILQPYVWINSSPLC